MAQKKINKKKIWDTKTKGAVLLKKEEFSEDTRNEV